MIGPPFPFTLERSGRGPGGAEDGRVVIWRAGRAFERLDCGRTSSRFTGMPRDIRC